MKSLRQHRTRPKVQEDEGRIIQKSGGCPGSVAAGKANQAARQGLSARIRFVSANTKFSLAVCLCRPRYRVFLQWNLPLTTAKTLYWYDRLERHLGWRSAGKVLCGGVMAAGDIAGRKELDEARQLGASISSGQIN